MSASSLESLLEKVTAGERLEEAELAALQKQTQRCAGPSVQVAYALALVNGGAAAQGLARLEALADDYPHEPRVFVGLGRAHAAAGNDTAAAVAWARALGLNPEEGEASSGLVLLALRAGDKPRARRLVADWLARTPEDDDAQLWAQQLAVPRPTPPPPPGTSLSIERFVALLGDALTCEGIPHLRQKNTLFIRLLRSRVARLDVETLHRDAAAEGVGSEIVAQCAVKELTERAMGWPRTAPGFLARVLPVVQAASTAGLSAGLMGREGPHGLHLGFALEDESALRECPARLLEMLGLSLDEVEAAAWSNLAQRPPQVRPVALREGALTWSREDTGLWVLCGHAGAEAARLLLPGQHALVAQACHAARFDVHLGLKDHVLFCASGDRGAADLVDSLANLPLTPGGVFCWQPTGVFPRRKVEV